MMFCQKCGQQLADGAQFCPACGEKIAPVNPASAAPVGNMPQQQYGAQPVNPVQPVNQAQPAYPAQPANPVQPTYQAQPAYPAQPMYQAPYPNKTFSGNATINKTGYTLAVILSAVAMGMYLISIIAYEFPDFYFLNFLQNSIELVLCMIPFFIFCLLLKKLPAYVTGIPVAISELMVIIRLISAFGGDMFEFTDGTYALRIIFSLIHIAGIVLYIISLLPNQRQGITPMKIVSASLLGVCAMYHLVCFIIDINNFLVYADAGIIIGWTASVLSELCLCAAMIVILFFSGKKEPAAPAPAPAPSYTPPTY